MIARLSTSNPGFTLALLLFAGLALGALNHAQGQGPPTPPKIAKPDAAKGVWAVSFEPVGDFSPKTPAEYLKRIHVYSGQNGMIGYFRTKKEGDRLLGSFLAWDPNQSKAALMKVPGLKVSAVEKLNQEQLVAYQNSQQESL